MYIYKLCMADWDRETWETIVMDPVIVKLAQDVTEGSVSILWSDDLRIMLRCKDHVPLQTQIDLLRRCQEIQDQTRDLVTSETFADEN